MESFADDQNRSVLTDHRALEQYANGILLGTATGFIWRRRDEPYLITNWHVVTGRDASTGEPLGPARPDMLRAYFNTRVMDFGKAVRDIRIRDADHNPLWFIEPTRRRTDDNELSPAPFGPKGRDVVAMPLPALGNDINLHPIAIEPDSELAVRIGIEVFILGYPFGNQSPGFPVWKRGSIASEPDLTRLGTGYLLVDTASRPEMSGAPVNRRSWGTHLTDNGDLTTDGWPRTKFIGVYSGRLHTNDKEDAQLGMVWPADDIDNIIDAAKRDH
jgi:Trypsin-like peptidase domain